MGSPVCCEACLTGLYGRPCTCDPSQWATAWDRIAADVITRHAATLERLALVDRLRTLAANLAVGGALCAADRLGADRGHVEGWNKCLRVGGDYPLGPKPWDWRPNVNGDRAPGCGRAWGGGE